MYFQECLSYMYDHMNICKPKPKLTQLTSLCMDVHNKKEDDRALSSTSVASQILEANKDSGVDIKVIFLEDNWALDSLTSSSGDKSLFSIISSLQSVEKLRTLESHVKKEALLPRRLEMAKSTSGGAKKEKKCVIN
jgi:hypothetical protein